jgi:polysaccharide pyruvyl transferase WcaK-like protein
MKSISIIAATISGNRGSEAMATTVIGRIREKYPDAVYNLFSYYPDADARLVNKPEIRIFSSTPVFLVCVLFPASLAAWCLKKTGLGRLLRFFPEAVRELERSSVLVDLAGVSFMDGRAKFLPFNILTIWPAMLLGVPVVKFSQALGPFSGTLVRLVSRFFLPRCSRIFARGSETERLLKGLGLGNVASAADTAFCHEIGDSVSRENGEYVADLERTLEGWRREGRKIVGLCPSSVVASKARNEGRNYPLFLYRLTDALVRRGFSVLLFPNATRQASAKLRNNDIPVIEDAVRYFAVFSSSGDNVRCAVRDINTDSIKRLIRLCDVTAVSRFHAMIASLLLGVPPVVMGWGHKYFEVMESFGLARFVFDYSKSDEEGLAEIIAEACAEREAIGLRIGERLPERRSSSYRQFEYVFSLLES